MESAIILENLALYKAPEEGTKVVFTNGCFDLIHSGHIHILKESRVLGDYLIVGLNTDSSVQRLKGPDRPINHWVDRAQVLASIRYVDCIIGFDGDTPMELIEHLRPDIITKGGDYDMEEMIGREFVTGYGGEVAILPFIEGVSSTSMIEKIKSHPG